MNEEKLRKKTLFWTRITGISSLIVLLCVLAVTTVLLRYQPRVNTILGNLEQISTELDAGSRELTRTLNSLNNEGLSKMYGTLENIQKIDINKLNQSIDSLYQVVDPLARLFR